MIGEAFALAAFALIGVGMLAFAWAAAGARTRPRAWACRTVFIALPMLITAWSLPPARAASPISCYSPAGWWRCPCGSCGQRC
jgi:hypothetical protein